MRVGRAGEGRQRRSRRRSPSRRSPLRRGGAQPSSLAPTPGTLRAVRGRYAPSPTGRLHLGNARTALIAWLAARSRGASFVMRVEDLDPQRSRGELEAEQLADLRWLGLDWDEGPDVGGPHGPYRQSERVEAYAAALEGLEVFPCSCSRREVRELALAPHGREPIYPGTCRAGPRRPDRPLAIRWRTPAGVVTFVDRVQGCRSENVRRDVGEFVLRRADGVWAYQLAVVVDDQAMAIEQVVRGSDLIESTARQRLLQRALGYRETEYAHIPIVTGPDGSKLNKRHGAPDLSTMRLAGVDPRRVVAMLAASAGLIDAGQTHVQPRELVGGFDWGRIPPQSVSLVDVGLWNKEA
ncbi:MAG: tRNA glutamyl-Q(34) synthetase GluQRS [Myxococcales bacterium FL481]|nr:MAG: tRNA glutamyl-Q(34) synthetase GluQRS [Myxococcales bacterium FL481]